MLTSSYIVAASQLFAVAFGAPLLTSDANAARSLVERKAYQVFGGDGTTAQGWPAESEWRSFEELWAANNKTMGSSCSQFNMENNDATEIENIKKAIEKVAGEKIDKRFVLAIVMQESKGCVRAPTTNYGFDNPGLMQSFQGKHSCNPSGTGIKPCPMDQITGMIEDGVGEKLENGLIPALKKAAVNDVSKYYKASRIYNSGSIDGSGNLGAGIATHCYATDVANRLLGWTDGDSHGCDEEKIKTAGPGKPNSKGEGETTEPAKDDPKGEAPKNEDDKPTETHANGGSSDPSGPKAEGASANCKKWYTVKAGDSCESTGVSAAKLAELNTSLKPDCSNLWAGSAYCIA